MASEMFNVTKDCHGLVQFYIRKAGETEWTLESQHNLIVNNARLIVRNLVLGYLPEDATKAAPTITHLVMGDSGMTIDEANQGLPEPSADDKVLTNPLLWIPVKDTGDGQWANNKVSPVIYKGLNSIKYEFFIGREQGNQSAFYNELGLALDKTLYPDAYLFSKLNRAKPFLKDIDTELLLNYILMF